MFDKRVDWVYHLHMMRQTESKNANAKGQDMSNSKAVEAVKAMSKVASFLGAESVEDRIMFDEYVDGWDSHTVGACSVHVATNCDGDVYCYGMACGARVAYTSKREIAADFWRSAVALDKATKAAIR